MGRRLTADRHCAIFVTWRLPTTSPWRVLPQITFRLQSFTSTCAVFGPWLEFISQQPELQEVAFQADVLGPVPDSTLLPMLRQLTARPADFARFANYRLTHMWLWLYPPYGQRTLYTRELARLSSSPARLLVLRINAAQFLLLLHSAPIILGALEHLVLEEDKGWANFDSEVCYFVSAVQPC